ncbi:hypothetical protein CsatA_014970 [Cannabis sativa]
MPWKCSLGYLEQEPVIRRSAKVPVRLTGTPEFGIQIRIKMNKGGYSVEVTGLSPKATEKDVSDFFSFFRYSSMESGATIVDQRVCITRWGQYRDEFDFWNSSSETREHESSSKGTQRNQFVFDAGEAVTMAQEVVKTMVAKGFVLSKDALARAKDYDESHQVSATAASKVAELSQRIGLANTISAGVQAAKSVDEKYHVSKMTKSAVLATGRTACAAANTVVNSRYFSKGALWV